MQLNCQYIYQSIIKFNAIVGEYLDEAIMLYHNKVKEELKNIFYNLLILKLELLSIW